MLAALANELAEQPRPKLLSTLAAAQAASGEFELAAQTMQRALELAEGGPAERLLPEYRRRLAMYRRGVAFVDEAAR